MPPRGWTAKDDRKYEHIKESELDRGVRESTAKEIAARTVNKDRRLEGRTPNKRTQGAGNPNLPLAERTRDELYNLAREIGVKGRSTMTKAELVSTLKR